MKVYRQEPGNIVTAVQDTVRCEAQGAGDRCSRWRRLRTARVLVSMVMLVTLLMTGCRYSAEPGSSCTFVSTVCTAVLLVSCTAHTLYAHHPQP